MTEMLERMARKLCDWVGDDDWSAADREEYYEGARELLEAMREPTPEMIAAWKDAPSRTDYPPGIRRDWCPIIDAILGKQS